MKNIVRTKELVNSIIQDNSINTALELVGVRGGGSLCTFQQGMDNSDHYSSEN
jgi:hypothetical protein